MSTIPKEIIKKLWEICEESDGFDIATKAYQLALSSPSLDDKEFWTEEMILRFAELYRWSSGRITMKGFKESEDWQMADITDAKENAKNIDDKDKRIEELKAENERLRASHTDQ